MKVFKSFRNVKLLWHWLEKTVTFLKMINFKLFLEEIDQSVSRGTTGKFEVIMDHFEVGELFLKTDFSLLVETTKLRNHNFFVKNIKITSDLSVVSAFPLLDFSLFNECIVLKQ